MPLTRSRLAWVLASVTILLAVTDVVTTEYIIRHLGGAEGQPLIAWLMKHLGIWWIFPKLLANFAMTVILLFSWKHRLAKIGMGIYVVMYSLVMIYHSVIILMN